MAKKVTIRELATALDLSAATVSRALNDHPLISSDTKRAVQGIAEKMGYETRSPSIRNGLSSRPKKAIAWISPLANFQFEDPNVLEMIGGMVGRSTELGRKFLHVPTDAGYELETYREMIASGIVDGFIVSNRLTSGDWRLEFLLDQKIPFVAYGATPASQPYPWVKVAFADAYMTATRYLIGLGHRRIALLNSMSGFQASSERERGYRAALAEEGIEVSESWVVAGPKNEEFGYRSMQQLLERTPAPTAVLCSSVHATKGALFSVAEHNLEVGRDISLIAFDDNIAGTFYSTPLTTMFSPVRSLGREAVNLLERAIDGEPPETLNHVQSTELVIRSSTGPAPKS